MVKLQDQILRRDNKTYFFGVELPAGFNNKEEIKEKENINMRLEEKSDDEEGKFQRFFLTEEQNLNENRVLKNKDTTSKNFNDEDDDGQVINKVFEKKINKLEEKKIHLNSNYDEFKKTAYEIVGENKEYENPINLNSAYKILKNIMKKPNSIDFEDFTEPHYMKPTSVIQKFKFNGFLYFVKI